MDLARKRGMKNHYVLTKRELQKSLVTNVDSRPRSKPYSFTKDSSEAEEREQFFKLGLGRRLWTSSERGRGELPRESKTV